MKGLKFMLAVFYFAFGSCYFGHAAQPAPDDDTRQNIRVEQQSAQFPGGQGAMNEFINENLEYPEDATKERISGNVGISFFVDIEGKISNIIVVQPVHASLDAEAVRIVESMPDWEPALRNNIAVRTNQMIFITFKL